MRNFSLSGQDFSGTSVGPLSVPFRERIFYEWPAFLGALYQSVPEEGSHYSLMRQRISRVWQPLVAALFVEDVLFVTCIRMFVLFCTVSRSTNSLGATKWALG